MIDANAGIIRAPARRPSRPMSRERFVSLVGLLVIALILGVAFRAYLTPDFAFDLGNLLFFCA